MFNKVYLLGHLGRDPEIRSTASGTPVGNFSIATNRKWRDREGAQQEETEWHHVVVWGRQAEIAGQYLTKGRLLFVEGRLRTSSWEDRQSGEKRYRTEIVCENFKMLGGRDGGGGGGYGGPSAEPPGGYESYGGGGGGGYDGGGDDFGGGGGGGGGGGSAPAAGGASSGGGEPEDDDIPF